MVLGTIFGNEKYGEKITAENTDCPQDTLDIKNSFWVFFTSVLCCRQFSTSKQNTKCFTPD